MKKIKHYLIILSFVFLSACSKKETYNYLHDPSEIISIEIVELTSYNDEEYKFEYTCLGEIEDFDMFVEELSAIECDFHFTDPKQLELKDVVFKITYGTGDYELISDDAQLRYCTEGSPYGRQELEREQFLELIEKYLTD